MDIQLHPAAQLIKTTPKILDLWDSLTRLSLSNPITPCNPDTLANIALSNAHDCSGAPVLVRSFHLILEPNEWTPTLLVIPI